MFYSSFRFTEKLSIKYREFLYNPCPHTCRASPTINIPHQSGTFPIIIELTLTHHHPKSTVYTRVHSWCYTFYEGFFFLFFPLAIFGVHQSHQWALAALGVQEEPLTHVSGYLVDMEGQQKHGCRPAQVWTCPIGHGCWRLPGDLPVVHGDLEFHHLILLTLILLTLHKQHQSPLASLPPSLPLPPPVPPSSSICYSPGILVSFKVSPVADWEVSAVAKQSCSTWNQPPVLPPRPGPLVPMSFDKCIMTYIYH